jgi:hypothetical protein
MKGRWTALICVLAVILGIGLLSAALHVPKPAVAAGSSDAIPVPPANALSSSAFCVAGTGTAAATTIYLTNSTAKPVSGTMVAVGLPRRGGAVTTLRKGVVVPALGSVALDPTSATLQGSTATWFTFAGGGVVASQAVSGPLGWSMAPCASQTSGRWAFAGGSTTSGNNLSLGLFDPATQNAVVNISFLTPTGLVTPQPYQGLVVPSGRVVVERIADYVQRASDIATLVTAQSGVLVASEFQEISVGHTSGLSLKLGSPGLSTVWRFPQNTDVPGSAVVFHLANPTTRTVSATISAGLSSGSVIPRRLSLPPLSIVEFNATAAAGLPQRIPYSVTVTSSAPIVVARSVSAPHGSSSPTWGSSSGTVTTATEWLVPGPGVLHAPGTAGAAIESLAVADPGVTAAQVEVFRLGAGHPLASFTVAPGRLVVLGPKVMRTLAVYTVMSSQRVNVEEDARPSGASGIVAWSGFPMGG